MKIFKKIKKYSKTTSGSKKFSLNIKIGLRFYFLFLKSSIKDLFFNFFFCGIRKVDEKIHFWYIYHVNGYGFNTS